MATNRYSVGWANPSNIFGNTTTTKPQLSVGSKGDFVVEGTLVATGGVSSRILNVSDLDHAVFKTDMSTLVNLWIARFGKDWVDKKEVIHDDFFEFAMLRLKSAGKLEEHVLWADGKFASNGERSTVLRIVDE